MSEINENKFRETLNELVSELNSINIDYCKDVKFDKDLITSFYKKCNELNTDFTDKNEIIFSKDNEIIKNIDFYKIWNNNLSQSNGEKIWKYLFTLYLYAFCFENNYKLVDIISEFKKSNLSDLNTIENNKKLIFVILDSFQTEKRNKKLEQKEISQKESDTPKLDHPIMKGEIGKLASEIAGEINPEEFKLDFNSENPNEIINNLFTGKIDKESPILNLVNTITNKIQNKVSNGQIDENALLNEAQGMLKNINGGDGTPPTDIFKNLGENILNSNTTDKNNIKERKKILREKMKNRAKLNKNNLK